MKISEARERRVKILAMRASGMGISEIARELGMTRQRVDQVLTCRRKPIDNSRKFTGARVTAWVVNRMFRKLTYSPRSLYLRLTPDDWSLTFERHRDSEVVGTYTDTVTIEQLVDDVEHTAAAIARQFRTRKAA